MFKIITTCYNCEFFIGQCIESVLSQNQTDWEMYITDDASTDRSVEVATKVANGDPRIKIIKNDRNMGAVFNKTSNFLNHAELNDEDVIVSLDGDDYLSSRYTLCLLKKIYSQGYWLSYGGFVASEKSFYKLAAPDHLTPIDWEKSLRNQTFCISALRSCKYFLLKNVRDKDLRHKDGELFKFPQDIILYIPMAEMAGKDKCYFLKEKIYWYRIHKNNDTFTNDEERMLITTNDLSFRPEYPRKTKEQLINWECDWS
jgi:glycosyltransferase involved in cell wall biosynthesis